MNRGRRRVFAARTLRSAAQVLSQRAIGKACSSAPPWVTLLNYTTHPTPPRLRGRTKTDTPPRLQESKGRNLWGLPPGSKRAPTTASACTKGTAEQGVPLYKLCERTVKSEPSVSPKPFTAPGLPQVAGWKMPIGSFISFVLQKRTTLRADPFGPTVSLAHPSS